MQICPRPKPVIVLHDPAPPAPEEIARRWLAQRFGLPPATAGAVRELALLATMKEAR